MSLFHLASQVHFALESEGEVPHSLIKQLGAELGIVGEIRRGYIKLALTSYNELGKVLQDLTEAELHEALSVESQTQRRPAIMERMVRRLVRLSEIRVKNQLTRKYLNQPKKEKRNAP